MSKIGLFTQVISGLKTKYSIVGDSWQFLRVYVSLSFQRTFHFSISNERVTPETLSGNVKKRVYLKTLSKQVGGWSRPLQRNYNELQWKKCLFAYIFTDFVYIFHVVWDFMHKKWWNIIFVAMFLSKIQ